MVWFMVHSSLKRSMMRTLLLLLYLQTFAQCETISLVSSTSATSGVSCRSERKVHLPFDEYTSDACARCYNYMPPVSFQSKLIYDMEVKALHDPHKNETYSVGLDFHQKVLDSFAEESFAEKWKGCCRAAWECCNTMVRTPTQEKDSIKCPRTWDGWQCWPDTLAGTVVKQPCEAHIYFENGPPSCVRYAYKECTLNGTWYVKPNLREWTNYTKCGRREEHVGYLHFHIATYVISILFIMPALIIFSIYKQLQVPRITMHKNLFMSLFLNALCAVLFKSIVIADKLQKVGSSETVLDTNGSGCRFLLILTKYFRMTNYMWMFCEGFYLQKLIAATFAEQRNLIIFYIIGWVVPIVPVGIYAILRVTLEDESCWAFPVEVFEWIVNVPNLLSLLVNLFFLCNIIRILVTKLRATHAKEPSQYRKAVRATLVLVPLFGLNFCVIMYKPHAGKCGLFQAYLYFSYAMDGLQGFMVAIIFCYFNGEVLYLIKRSYQRYKLNNQFRSRKNSAIMRRWSTTLTTLNESQNHTHHRSRNQSGDQLKTIKETENHSLTKTETCELPQNQSCHTNIS